MAMSRPLPFVPFDTETLMAAQQRNIDALASAGQIVVDGAKAIAQRQSEMLQSSVDQLMSAGHDALSIKAADLRPADQLAKAKAQYEAAVNNARELAEIAMKVQGDAVAVLSKCVMANIDDLKAMSKPA